MLSGMKILEEIQSGNILIEPFDPKFLNPNSYNIRIGNKLLIHRDEILDIKKKPETVEIEIPEEGLVLQPGEFYLASSFERTATDRYVPMIEGRSSIGRLGMFVHASASFGDVGFNGKWTFQLVPTKPIRIYPYIPIAQIYYYTLEGDFELYGKVRSNPNSGKYTNNDGTLKSSIADEFK